MRGRERIQFILFFTEQLVAVTEENLPLAPSLRMIASDTEEVGFRRVIEAIAKDMEEGHSLYESLSRRRQAFPKLYLKMVNIGERNGNLSQMLRHLLDHFQRMDKFREMIGERLSYPVIVFFVILGILSVVIRFVFPVYKEMLAEIGGIELPLSTTYLMATLDWLYANSYLLFSGLVVLVFVLGIIYLLANKIPLIRLSLDKLYLSLPIIGPMVREMSLIRISYTLGTLLESGTPLDEALETTGEVPMNSFLQQEMRRMARGIREGENLSYLLQERRLFPSTFTWITSVGEGRGLLEKSLLQAGDFYSMKLEAALTRIAVMAEPIAVLIAGCLVAFIVTGMFSALVAMANNLMI
jgi:type IV pilus assembly protein PilC